MYPTVNSISVGYRVLNKENPPKRLTNLGVTEGYLAVASLAYPQ